MRSVEIVLVFLVAVLAAGAAAAQDAAPAGATAESESGRTELSFSSEDSGLQIQIVDGGPGRIPERDCRTPCRFRVHDGNYTLRAGDYEFEVRADGGLQQWLVEDNSTSGLAVGIIGMVFGAAAVGVGSWGLATLVPQDDPNQDWLIASAVSTGVGGAAFVGGIVALALSFGSADLLSFSPTIDESATLTGRVALFPGGSGDPGWGLSLALTL
jgi:hypothetical protein